MRIIREDIKPGKSAAHEKTEAAFARALSKSKYPNYTAVVNLTGPSHALFLERYDSFASLGETIEMSNSGPMGAELAQLDVPDAETRTGERVLVATYRKELSYTPVPAELAKYKYYSILTVHIRPGHIDDYEALRKMVNVMWEKSGSKQRRVVYGVVSGAPTAPTSY